MTAVRLGVLLYGAPLHPDELARHRCFNFNFRRSLDEWPFLVDQHTVYMQVRGGLLTNNGATMRKLTLIGCGCSSISWWSGSVPR